MAHMHGALGHTLEAARQQRQGHQHQHGSRTLASLVSRCCCSSSSKCRGC
jgi:hypothetical protein